MGRIPDFLLRHRTRVAKPTATFGVYGPEQVVRCLVSLDLTGRGKNRLERVTLRAQLPAAKLLVPGARVVLPDGRVGHVQVVVAHTTAGLPTPDHVEAGIDAVTVAEGGGENVTLLRRVKAGVDSRYGTDRYTTTEVVVGGVGVVQYDSQETHDGGAADSTLAMQVDLTFPLGTVVKATDRVRVRGLEFELIEQAIPDASEGLAKPFTVRARRVTG